MVRLCQRDPKWADITIGNTDITLGRYGCTITCCCMVHSQFYPEHYITPGQAAKEWYFVDSGKLAASIHWAKTKFTGMEFKWRQRGYNTKDDYHRVASHANNKYLGAIIQVDNHHWLVVEKAYLGQFIIIDPWTGKRNYWWQTTYDKITGYALFLKDQKE